MRYSSSSAFRAALDDRLKMASAETGLSLMRLRKRVAFELFLRRLVIAAPDRWVLKGALALDFRVSAPTRSTKDVDIGRDDDEEAAVEDLLAAQELSLDDHFSYVVMRSESFDDSDAFSALRFNVKAELAGRTFDSFVLDVAFVDPLPSRPEIVRTTSFLSFADIEQVSIPAVPIHDHLAEKVHAYTRKYAGGRASTRPKDLIDILLIQGAEPLSASELRNALVRTFTARGTHALPDRLPAPPPRWAAPYGQLAAEVGLDPALAVGYEVAAGLLDPVLDGLAQGVWNSELSRWVVD